MGCDLEDIGCKSIYVDGASGHPLIVWSVPSSGTSPTFRLVRSRDSRQSRRPASPAWIWTSPRTIVISLPVLDRTLVEHRTKSRAKARAERSGVWRVAINVHTSGEGVRPDIQKRAAPSYPYALPDRRRTQTKVGHATVHTTSPLSANRHCVRC